MGAQRRPGFQSLPLDPSHPPFSAWGLYGPDDELGTLNLLTEETLLATKSEITTGKTFSLNHPINFPLVPMNPDRRPCEHRFNQKSLSNDDELDIDTQGSSHWDGLRHVGYRDGRLFYNGSTQQDITGPNANPRNGVQNLARKAIAGRGVLLDYRSWATEQGIYYDAFDTHRITLDELLRCAESQRVEFHPGDILLIRSGWTEDYNKRSMEEKRALAARPSRTFVGVENSIEVAEWHWEMGFAAVAGDTNAYEAWPPTESASSDLILPYSLHEVFLAGWGMPIGEVWNLENLASECRRLQRWSFFLVSQPLDIPGGVASPANAVAIM
ncbi:putative cyclase-domain-containing protein [Aspergillus pseudoustus]|uniref:Cyclase-domain-containing protein n=1 Tax=Aspergillus pseudoustus TaxID=1810923 RepID=A0ABR4JYD0_9EURO